MKKTHLYWHRTIYALKKIPSFFRDWEETVSVGNTPNYICEAMEEHPHLVEKQLAFLMSAPASDFEKNQIWTHVFIKALELGQHDTAELAANKITHPGWTALASLPFNSPRLLKKYLPKNIQHAKDFKNILFNLALKNNSVNSLSEIIGATFCEDNRLKLDNISREEIVRQMSRYASNEGFRLATFSDRINCALESADCIIDLAKQDDVRACLVLNAMEYGRFAVFEKVAAEVNSYSSNLKEHLLQSLPKFFEDVQTDIELKSMCNALLSVMQCSDFSMKPNDFLVVLQEIAHKKFNTQVEEIDAIFETTPADLLKCVLPKLSEKDKQKLSLCGVLTASLIQRQTLMEETQTAAPSLQRRKM